MMQPELKQSAQSVQKAIFEKGLALEVVELPSSTRTAQDAASSIGCTVGQIVKSLIFRTKEAQTPVLVLASGENQVDTTKVSSLIGEEIEKADPAYVREITGFAIGGIPPIGHRKLITTIIDEDLLKLDVLWAAAGTPNAVFRLESGNLLKLTDGKVANIKS